MKKHIPLSRIAKKALEKKYDLTVKDIGEDAVFSKKGVTFNTQVCCIGDIGQICFIQVKAMLGFLKMETVVLSVSGKDIPLFNMDWVSAFGKETLICELYDVQLSPFSDEIQKRLCDIIKRDEDIPDTEQDEQWYNNILYPCSYHKSSKHATSRFNDAAIEYIKQMVNEMHRLDECEKDAKHEKIRSFAGNLYNEGSPVLDIVKEFFGEECAKRLLIGHMYGCMDMLEEETENQP